MHLVIVGAGFAGAILARVARVLGYEVTLLDKGTHPRFALGESSTPLAAISLERLARRYGLDDLRALATYGRWQRELSEVGCGLKRGFTFYRHQRGHPFSNDQTNPHRLLVAASPDDAVADTHWRRSDVDHFLARRAAAEGVRYLDATELNRLESRGQSFRCTADGGSGRVELHADVIVDASGSAGVAARQLGAANLRPPSGLRTGLVYGHFAGVHPLRSVVSDPLPSGPFPDERAAVHHLLDEGWMYELRFDDDVVSAGFVLEQPAARGPAEQTARLSKADPLSLFRDLLRPYPTLAAQFATARPIRPVATIPHLQRRLTRAAGDRWAVLPHTYMFWSPMFSTGIAWSLLGVERLGLILEQAKNARRLSSSLYRYGETLHIEGRFLRRLIEGAYRARHRFDVFVALAQIYFAAASYCEARQRLCDPPSGLGGEWAWAGFLGATDLTLKRIVSEADRFTKDDSRVPELASVEDLIRYRNLAGLADPSRRRLYPVDLDALVEASRMIGLEPEQARAQLPRLRGG